MENYYSLLGIEKNKNIEDINVDLNRLESVWKRREITNPEKATYTLALIFQARKIFASDASRREYDIELAKSQQESKEIDPDANRNQQFKKWHLDANNYLNGNQFDLAKTAIDKALSYYNQEDDNDVFLSLVAIIYSKNQMYSTAIDYINKAIVINPRNPSYYVDKASIILSQAFTLQGYNNKAIRENLFQNAATITEQAVKLARDQNNKATESGALGMLAFCYYHSPSPNIDKAEEYAKKSCELGDSWGNAEKILNEIESKRQEEIKIAEQQRIQKIQRDKEAQERKERQEQEDKRKKQISRNKAIAKVLNKLCMLAYFGWAVYNIYLYIKYNIYGISVPFVTTVFLIIISFWNLSEIIATGDGVVSKFISGVGFIGYAFLAGTVYYSQNGFSSTSAHSTWKFVGITLIIYIMVLVITNLIGKTINKKK